MNYQKIKHFTQPQARISVAGWVQTVRSASKGKLFFITINDGSTFNGLQIVADRLVQLNDFELKDLSTGCSITVTGDLVESIGKGQKFELQAKTIALLGGIGDKETYPLPAQKQSLEKLRTMLHLRSHTQIMRAVMKVRNVLSMATHAFFQAEDCIWVHTPIITGSDCEGAGEMFQVTTMLKDNTADLPTIPSKEEIYYGKLDYEKDFFKKKAFLTVSGQLDAEMYACGMGSVYTFGPTFRAENSHTARHLAEFWMVEPEMAFVDLNGIAAVAERYIKYMITCALAECPDELEYLEARSDNNKGLVRFLQQVCDEPFARITYTDAIKELQQATITFEEDPVWGMDLGSEHERYLAEQVYLKPVIITDYPLAIKAFYMKANPDQKTVAAMDIIVPGIGELVGGSQREEDYNVLVDKIKALGLDIDSYKEYLDLRKYGTVPHSGFGLGFERMVRFVCGLENIREAIPFPKWPGHL